MEANIITTYRCNAKCGMCDIWKFPTKPSEEFKPEILKKLPTGISKLNITGGEPTLRKDIDEILDIVVKKSHGVEISTNGFFTSVLDRVTKKHSDIGVRISIEGLPEMNDKLRGIPNGFDRAVRSFLKLRANGVKNIGFAMTISGENCRDLLPVYQMCSALECQLANAVVHNSFYFRKTDNKVDNFTEVEEAMQEFIEALLTSSRKQLLKGKFKDWLRAYINQGLLKHVQGKIRSLPCGAATDSFFLDPYGRILACNGSIEPMIMGDLTKQSFDEIWNSKQAEILREQVKNCKQNCWMTGTAVPAMRKNPIVPALWVLKQKTRLRQGKRTDLS
ncbi:MAG: radical SAM protein [Candidatus Sabulitectum sp.]|nr:radical SAM protein [Candidatus Sabulitectum sp.]